MFSSIINSSKFYIQSDAAKIFTQQFCTKSDKYTVLDNRLNSLSSENRTKAHPIYGQPLPDTHPHLLKKEELVPGIKKEEFIERRKNFMESIFTDAYSLHGRSIHHVIIIPSATKIYMTEKIPYVFHQNNDFLYLTGCLEPDTALILTGSDTNNCTSTLFLRERSSHSELWEGPRTGVDSAPDLFGVDQACLTDILSEFLAQNMTEQNHLFYYDVQNSSQLPLHSIINSHIMKHNITQCKSCKYFIHKLRVIKSEAEQELLKQAGIISSQAFIQSMIATKPGITEHQLFATVDYESRMRGAEILAYPPVVACGKNATIIHYINNNQYIYDGDLILMDAGCEYHSYCADITRTWPANGKFTSYQKILYEIVLEVQKKLILICEERLSLDFMRQRMIVLLGEYLSVEKIIKKNISSQTEIIALANQLCPHHVGHYLGMDIHDVNLIHKQLHLQPGIVITIEPGIYVKEGNLNVAPEFWNLGIRIEDDILITNSSYKILSADCPKEVNEIENVMKMNTLIV